LRDRCHSQQNCIGARGIQNWRSVWPDLGSAIFVEDDLESEMSQTGNGQSWSVMRHDLASEIDCVGLTVEWNLKSDLCHENRSLLLVFESQEF
jgi:hypothetical protein